MQCKSKSNIPDLHYLAKAAKRSHSQPNLNLKTKPYHFATTFFVNLGRN